MKVLTDKEYFGIIDEKKRLEKKWVLLSEYLELVSNHHKNNVNYGSVQSEGALCAIREVVKKIRELMEGR